VCLWSCLLATACMNIAFALNRVSFTHVGVVKASEKFSRPRLWGPEPPPFKPTDCLVCPFLGDNMSVSIPLGIKCAVDGEHEIDGLNAYVRTIVISRKRMLIDEYQSSRHTMSLSFCNEKKQWKFTRHFVHI
jgi:hypothetical protein